MSRTSYNKVIGENSSIKVSNIYSDSFNRTIVATPTSLFDAQFTYDLHPLLYEVVNSANGSITHNATERAADINLSNALTGENTFIQSYEYQRYQPAKAQQIFITFNAEGLISDRRFYAQYGDAFNAVGFAINDGVPEFFINTTTSQGNQVLQFNNWVNQDLAALLDFTKEQIFFIDLQALYVGSVYFGFEIEGLPILFGVIHNENNTLAPYIATANLPIRVGVEALADNVTTNVLFNCCSIISSGGIDDTVGYPFFVYASGIAGNGTRTHLASVRPKLTFNGFENRVQFRLESVDLIVTGNNPVLFELAIGQPLTGGSWNDVNTALSAFEFSTAGSTDGAATMYFGGGLVPSSGQFKGILSKNETLRIPITLDAAGLQRLNGTLSALATGIGGTSACSIKLNWKEVR